ncbi:alpha-amylase family glycosyl hydrolase [Virgibacillus necropolis]|uniref:Alpha-amlyase n=1 Tax=Virgibacillus necropolis TaxID=163877 RepID=A0A221MG02_9BACI|nr:alpha-amylase family glycosyl hydrolase [Virgibacillus necropolis]ASN06542.1 alpha-amlyase [Virgibacillus necropolis]
MKKAILSSFFILFVMIGAFPVHAVEKPIKEEIIYSIVVDRFNNGNQAIDDQVDLKDQTAYHGGDIEGITKKLDEIKAYGFTTISLSPIMANAPGSFHGYRIEDLFKVEEQFGTLEDLQKLVKEAHDRNMKVVLEFVTNYVAPTHPLVDDPAKAEWTKQTTVNDTLWLDDAITLNQSNAEVKEMLFEAATFWLEEANIDGYKLHAIDQTSPAFLTDFVDHVKSVKPDIFLLGDVLSETPLSEDYLDIGIPLIEYAPIQESIVNVFTNVGTPVTNIYNTWEETGKREGLIYVDNVYTERFTRKIVEGSLNPETTWKLALAYLYTSPGVPLIFQGSEVPMDGDTTEEVLEMVQFNSGNEKIRDFLEKISAIRTQFPVLSYGDFNLVDTNGALSVFKRTYKDETMFIAYNNDTETKTVSVKDVPEGMQLSGLLGDNIVRENEQDEYKIALDRETVEVYILEEDQGLNWLFIGMVVGIFVIFITAIMILSYKQRKRERKSL